MNEVNVENVEVEDLLDKNPVLSVGQSILNVARHPHKTTPKYTPTDDVALVRSLNEKGWVVKNYRQIKARLISEQVFKPYLAVFENVNLPVLEGEGTFQILQRNAKDGTKSYEFMIGFFRTTGSNSLVAGTNLFQPIKIRHIGSLPLQVAEALETIVTKVPDLYNRIKEMKSVTLTQSQKETFAKAAVVIRCGKERAQAMDVKELLTPRHEVDMGNDTLWSVFNTVQENLVQCPVGVHMLTPKNTVRKARALTNINASVKVNRELWNLAEEFLS